MYVSTLQTILNFCLVVVVLPGPEVMASGYASNRVLFTQCLLSIPLDELLGFMHVVVSIQSPLLSGWKLMGTCTIAHISL